MKIAIFDIDDTLTYETEFLKENAPRFLKKRYGFDVQIINENGYNLDQIYNIKENLLKRGFSEEDSICISKKITDEFWNKYFIKYNMTKLRPNVSRLIADLRKEGYEIHLVSLRGKKTKENESVLNEFIRKNIVPLITKMQLKIGNIKYDKLVLVQNSQEKLDYIKHYNPDFVFDDQIYILENIECKCKKYCINNSHNIDKDLLNSIIRIGDYSECSNIINSDCVGKKQNVCNIKINKKFVDKVMTEITQKIVVSIGKYYFIHNYRPIVCGSERIPSNEGIAFVGNHRNKLDPVFITISSGKSIHWAALLRMFQGKEDLFSLSKGKLKCDLSAKFISAVGALPIARPTDENYEEINMSTISKLTDLLEMNSSIGFFPEGTLNRNPENANILTLKSNRVFRMATDTDSFVQPVSIVWIPSELGIKNRVIISYSYPINTNNRNKKIVKDIWQESVNLNIEKSKEFIQKVSELENVSTKHDEVKKLIKKLKSSV